MQRRSDPGTGTATDERWRPDHPVTCSRQDGCTLVRLLLLKTLPRFEELATACATVKASASASSRWLHTAESTASGRRSSSRHAARIFGTVGLLKTPRSDRSAIANRVLDRANDGRNRSVDLFQQVHSHLFPPASATCVRHQPGLNIRAENPVWRCPQRGCDIPARTIISFCLAIRARRRDVDSGLAVSAP